MAEKIEISAETEVKDGGRIIFSDEVVATIAALATADVPGVFAMSGGVVEDFTEKLGRKNLTKGVKVEVGAEEAAVDLSLIIQYGFRIQEVCQNVQKAVQNAIETMTGLRVVEINVFVQSINFDVPDLKAEKKEKKEKERLEKEAEKEAERAEKAKAAEPEPPRVK